MGSPVPLSSDGFFGQRAARHFGVHGQEVSALRLEGELSLVATRLTCGGRLRERTQPAPPDAAFSLLCPIDRLDGHSCWVAGEPQHHVPLPAGSVSLTDLRDKPQWQLCGRHCASVVLLPCWLATCGATAGCLPLLVWQTLPRQAALEMQSAEQRSTGQCPWMGQHCVQVAVSPQDPHSSCC